MAKNKKRKPNTSSNDLHQRRRLHTAPESTKLPHKVEPIIPFDAEDSILLIGEGDFSFAKSIVENCGCFNVTATCHDTKEQLSEKYRPQAQEYVQFLEDEGQTALYSIDATKLDSNKALKKSGPFDRVIFNFPHVGGRSKDVNRQVRFNQELLVKFFASATPIIAIGGTIIVTLFEGEPYTLWNIRDLARHSGLEVQRSFKFFAETYPGYSHSRTLGNIEGGGGWKGEDRDARTYVFQKKGTPLGSIPGKKRKRHVESSDDEG